MLAAILPGGVVSRECFGEPRLGRLLPEEESAVVHAVATRRREYAAVRGLARLCLDRLGLPPTPILPGPGGAPVWPAGVRGSMTHCQGYAGTALGPADRLLAIGIDAEPDEPLPSGVLDLIAVPAEQDDLARCPAGSGAPHWDRLLFSAKEAVFKALFPLTGEWLEPTETVVRLDPASGTFTVEPPPGRVLVGGRPVPLGPGRWTRDRGILQTAFVVRSVSGP